MTPEVLVRRFDELNSLTFWTCWFGQKLRALVERTSTESVARQSFKALADHYDSFLTRYEALLVKLPDDLDVPRRRPAPAVTTFFLRLREEPPRTSSAPSWIQTCDLGVARDARDV